MNCMDWFEQLSLSGTLGAVEATLLLIAVFAFVFCAFAALVWIATRSGSDE